MPAPAPPRRHRLRPRPQEIITRSGVGIDSSLSYCHYSLNDTTLESSGFVAFCKERNVALINASPISMGLLMERDPPDWRAPYSRLDYLTTIHTTIRLYTILLLYHTNIPLDYSRLTHPADPSPTVAAAHSERPRAPRATPAPRLPHARLRCAALLRLCAVTADDSTARCGVFPAGRLTRWRAQP